MLDGRVAVSKITEVMDIAGREQSSGGKGVDRRITPLKIHKLERADHNAAG